MNGPAQFGKDSAPNAASQIHQQNPANTPYTARR